MSEAFCPMRRPKGKKDQENEEKEEILIDLTLSSSEEEEDDNEELFEEEPCETDICPFSSPITIAGNVLTTRHYRLLEQGGWFTDDLINAYFHLLSSERVFSFSSFLLTAANKHGVDYVSRTWMKRLRKFLAAGETNDEQLVLFPINSGGSHWVLVAWWCRKGLMQYFDSLMNRRTGTRIMEKLKNIIEACHITSADSSDDDELDCLEQIMSSLSLTAPKEESIVPSISKLEIPAKQPHQQDGSSCGPFTCAFAEALVQAKPLSSINQETVDAFRLDLIDLFLQHK